jgi:hypothetical protein
MDCIEVEAHLPLFVGGDLEHPLTTDVEGHLAACEGCRTRLEAARRARSALLGLVDLDPSTELDLWPGVRARLVDEGLLTPLVHPGSGDPARVSARDLEGRLVGSHPSMDPVLANPVLANQGPGRRLRLVSSLAPVLMGAAAAVLAMLAWQPWADEAPTAPGEGPAAPVASAQPEPEASSPALPANWQPVHGTELAAADEPLEPLDAGRLTASVPLIPVTLQPAAPAGRGGLQRVGPGGTLLRDRARMYPEGPVLILSPHGGETQGGLSLISNGQLR